jgi:hypothetical protein
MKRIWNNARVVGPFALAVALLSGCPSTTVVTQACGGEEDPPCPSGFNCTEKVCKESLSCDLRTRGAPNPARAASPKAKGDECKDTKECIAGTYCDKFTDVCTEILASGAKCGSTASCPAGEYCKEGTCAKAGCAVDQFCRETVSSAECVVTGCRSSNECSGSQKCIESECKEPPTTAPDDCAIVNQAHTFAENATVDVQAVAFANGQVLPFRDYTVTSSDPTIFAVTGKSVKATGSAAGQSSITVSFGSVECADIFYHAGAVPADYSRIVLYETGPTGEPAAVAGFTAANFRFVAADGSSVEADAATFQTREGGVYLVKPGTPFTGPAESINIVANNYNPYTVVFAPAATADATLPLDKIGETAGFGGKPSFDKFDAEYPDLAEDANISAAYVGSSLPLTSLLNFSLDLFVGDTAPKAIDANILTSGSAGACTIVPNDKVQMEGEFPLPRSLYAQLGSGKIGVNCDGYATRAVPGRRLPWSIGAKLRTSDISKLVPVFTGSGGINIGSIIGAVLPFFDNFAIGNESLGTSSLLPRKAASLWDAFKQKSPGDMASDNSFPSVTASPNRRLKFTTNFDNPGVTQDIFPGATSTDTMNAFVTLVASVSKAYGIVPLGFGAGFDNTGDGKLDSLLPEDTARFPADKIHARNAAPSAELSDGDLVGVTVALNLGDLTAEMSKNPAIRVKGIVARDKGTGIGWSTTAPALGSFADSVKALNYDATATYALAAKTGGNTLQLPAFTATTQGADPKYVVIRISRTGSKRYWNVVVNPARATGPRIELSTNGFDTGIDDVVCSGCSAKNMSFTSTTLDVKNVDMDFNKRIGPVGGKDLDSIAGDTKSFTLYTQELGRAP